jgi:uncharacterized protein YcaQ
VSKEFAYPILALRTLALHAQGLDGSNACDPTPTAEVIYQTVARLGCIQIDTLQMVRRSHYLVLWSRLGNYNPADFDRMIYTPGERRLFEGWQRCASIIPLEHYRYQMPYQRHQRETSHHWYRNWLDQEGNAELVSLVMDRIQQEGPLRASDFEYKGPRRSSWWDWKPAKMALEHLYGFGDLMVSSRANFQRVYDLTGRVLPEWVDQSEPTPEECDRFWIEQAARALGACLPLQAADYSYRKRGPGRHHLEALLANGVLVQVDGELADRTTQSLIVHRDNLRLLEQAADGALLPKRTTFLSPFDSLFWARQRDQQFWNFDKSIEAYTPASKRKWGYYCLPILHRGRLVGRFDPKLERRAGLLRLKAIYLEEGIRPDEELVSCISSAMRDFLAFHEARDLVIERSEPAELGDRLVAAL